jgi:hypothetical protein
MSSIRSVLIRTSMSNIQKEISQLEHWLINLPDDIPPPSHPVHNQSDDIPGFDITKLYTVVNKLSEQISNQHYTLNNIIDRLDTIENGYTRERKIHIDGDIQNIAPWVDDNHSEPLRNEMIEGDTMSYEGDYPSIRMSANNVYKNDDKSDTSSVKTPSIIPDVPDDKSVIPDIHSVIDGECLGFRIEGTNNITLAPFTQFTTINENNYRKEEDVIVLDKMEVKEEKQTVNEVQKKDEVIKNEEIEELKEEKKVEEVKEEEEEEELKEEKKVEEVKEEEEEEEIEVEEEVEEVEVEVEEEEVEVEEEEEVEVEEEEEEEEEEGLELEEIEYNGTKYYKDNENFIYTISEDEQPSENPVGYWKEKTNSIAFYKTK